MKKFAIFDLDGTLLNTIDDLAAACNHALAEMGYPTHGLWLYPQMVGNGVRRLLQRALPDDARNDATVDRAYTLFTQYYDQHLTDATRPYPGIPELLQDLTDRDIALAVTSNKYEDAVQRLIAHYFPAIPFAAVLGSIPGYPPKPDPSIVFRALSLHPTPKDLTIYIGDSAVDIETARRASIENVGVTWGFRDLQELRRAYADHIISMPAQLLDLV